MKYIGITMGDPAGIGPEITLKAINEILKTEDNVKFHIYGDRMVYDQISKIGNIPISEDIIFVSDDILDEQINYGTLDSKYGYAAGYYIEQAILGAKSGAMDAIVTSPIHKVSFKLGGYGEKYAGHTEMFADLTNTENYSMLLAHGNLRVLHLTTHIPFNDVHKYITVPNIYDKLVLADDMCRKLGILKPRIAIAALNPHMGDGGLFGNDERIIYQAIEKFKVECRSEGIVTLDSDDVVFCKAVGGAYDVVLALHHSQGHIPVKLMGFKYNDGKWTEMNGVNCTLGMPIIRTSVDHGTAFGKAGKGIADHKSMVDAIHYAINLIEV